jgi:hydrogenase/urease accessory protein HupE
VKAFAILVLMFTGLFIAPQSDAHRFAPSLLRIAETSADEYRVLWKTPQKAASNTRLDPVLPESCIGVAESAPQLQGTGVLVVWNVSCSKSLIGDTIKVTGLAENRASVMVMVELSDGRVFQTTLSEGKSEFLVPERPSTWEVFNQYLAIGVEHILSGLDHLLFVLGLLLLVGTGRRLFWTVTAFTLGHSVTLSLAVLGYLSFPVAVIEFAIALSIFVIALQLVPAKKSSGGLIGRHPWWLAAGFGLLHGMGFAGALTEIGLPPGEVPMALFSFNVGIEVGQILFLLAVIGVWRLGEGLIANSMQKRLHWAPAYLLGGLSSMWCIERLLEAL